MNKVRVDKIKMQNQMKSKKHRREDREIEESYQKYASKSKPEEYQSGKLIL